MRGELRVPGGRRFARAAFHELQYATYQLGLLMPACWSALGANIATVERWGLRLGLQCV